jgi:Uncharacterized conserved protein (DUF2190)
MSANYLARSRIAIAVIAAYTIVKAGAGVNEATPATAATDKLLGTADELDTPVGDMVDISIAPVGTVKLGGTVAVGDLITSDANGRGVATTTAGNRYIGIAEQAGVAGDLITYLRAPGLI